MPESGESRKGFFMTETSEGAAPRRRRRFLEEIVRLTVLGALAALTASAIARSRRSPHDACGACPLASQCRSALRTREQTPISADSALPAAACTAGTNPRTLSGDNAPHHTRTTP
jgi:hypothetical protein